jgi:protein-tyrosine kinase
MSATDPKSGASDSDIDHQDTEHGDNNPDHSANDSSEPTGPDDFVASERADRPVDPPLFSTALIQSERHGLDEAPLRSLPTAHGEQIRRLRTELLLRHGYHNVAPLVLAVVSTSPRDGRSLLATELAISFAQLGRPTLLVDADMRTPRERRIFGHQLDRGLAQALATGDVPELNVIESYPTLSILGAGDESGFNPTELLSNKRFQRLIDSTRNLFDFIVVDTPPFNAYSDAQVIAAVVGRVITLHRAPVNTYKETREMLSSISRSGAEVLGAVLNNN